jgi:hypothetical protein
MIHIITGNYRAQIIHGFVSKKKIIHGFIKHHNRITAHSHNTRNNIYIASKATMAKAPV